jgi:hypothetical protein
MLPRLSNAWVNCSHGIVNLGQRLFRRTGESEQGFIAELCPTPATKLVDDRPFVPTGKQQSPDHAEFVRTQSQLMETMLKAMIVASGWKVDGRPDGTD